MTTSRLKHCLLGLVLSPGCGAQSLDDGQRERHWSEQSGETQAQAPSSEAQAAQGAHTSAAVPNRTALAPAEVPNVEVREVEMLEVAVQELDVPNAEVLDALEAVAGAQQAEQRAPSSLDNRPDVQSVRQWGGVHHDNVDQIAIDSGDNVIVVGHVSVGTQDEGAADRAQFVSKLSPMGAELWSIETPDRRRIDTPQTVAVDAAGNIFVAVSVDGSMHTDASLTRYSPDGQLDWQVEWGTAKAVFVDGLTVDAAGNVFVCGDTQGAFEGANAGASDVFISKLDAEGELQWTRQWGTEEGDVAANVRVDLEGNIVVGTRQGNKVEALDTAVTKLDAEGSLLWTYAWEAPEDTGLFDLATDPQGNIYVGGYTRQGRAPENGFVAKLSSEGSLLWTHAWDTPTGDQVTSIALDPAGGLVVASVAYSLGSTSVSRFDAQGDLEWSEDFGSAEHDHITTLAVDGAGDILAAGETYGAMHGFNAGDSDYFVFKVDGSARQR